jgi:hypothetical protein
MSYTVLIFAFFQEWTQLFRNIQVMKWIPLIIRMTMVSVLYSCIISFHRSIYLSGSMMHYPSTAFSKNGQSTIDKIRSGFENQVNSIGRSGRFAGWDVEKLKKRYGC